MNTTLVWFRRNLRVSDHEPLLRAARRGWVVPVFNLRSRPAKQLKAQRGKFLISAAPTLPPKRKALSLFEKRYRG